MTTELDQRYNWHPLVHARYGETLYFYLLRLREPLRGPVAEQIRSVLQRAEVRYACEYTVFGHWDGLVRVWLTPASRHRLLEVFKRADTNVADVREFRVDEIRYLWSGTDADLVSANEPHPEVIAERSADVVTVAEHPNDADDSAVARLLDRRLLIRRPDSHAGSVKFYVSLTRTSGELRAESEERAVVDAVHAAELADRASVYVGLGSFGDYLLRCVADSFGEVLAYTARLDLALKDLRVRPMTLLVANIDARESDNINDLYALSSDDEATMSLLELGDSGPALLERLTPQERHALHRLVDDAYAVSEGNTTLRAKLRALVRASLENDRDALTSAAAFLLEFEWLLGQFLKRSWAEVYGPDMWLASVAQELEANGCVREAATARDPENWSLGGCVHMALASADVEPRVAALFGARLGDRWKRQLRDLIPVRNLLAHGRLRAYARFDDFAGDWGEELARLLNIASLHFKLDMLIAEGATV